MVFSCGLLSKRITIVLYTKQCRCHWTRHWPRVFAKHNFSENGHSELFLTDLDSESGEIRTFRKSFVAYPARQARSIFGRHFGNIWITFSYGQRKPASLSCGLAGTSFAYVSPRVPPHMDCEVCAGADRNSDFTRFWIGCHQAGRAEAYEFHNRAFPATASRSSSKVQPRGYTDARTQVVGERCRWRSKRRRSTKEGRSRRCSWRSPCMPHIGRRCRPECASANPEARIRTTSGFTGKSCRLVTYNDSCDRGRIAPITREVGSDDHSDATHDRIFTSRIHINSRGKIRRVYAYRAFFRHCVGAGSKALEDLLRRMMLCGAALRGVVRACALRHSQMWVSQAGSQSCILREGPVEASRRLAGAARLG